MESMFDEKSITWFLQHTHCFQGFHIDILGALDASFDGIYFLSVNLICKP